MGTLKFKINSATELLKIFGPQDKNLRFLEREYNVRFFIEKGFIIVQGKKSELSKISGYIEDALSGKPETGDSSFGREESCAPGAGGVKGLQPRTPNQKKFVETVLRNDLVFAVGPAGTGKTFLSVYCAINALLEGRVKKIVITRPVVEAGEKLGFLPGDLYEKINPYLKPIDDAFFFILGPARYKRLKEDGIVEIVPLAYMRGRTLANSFIILDEAQNTTLKQMKMFLTRLGFSSKMIVTGDVTQVDLDSLDASGLIFAERQFRDIPGIGFCYFTAHDIMRHPIIKKIIDAYEKKGIF